MNAAVGDRIVVASNSLDRPVRLGRIIELRHPDGSPPYVVEWSDTGQTGLVFPGPDARVEHDTERGGGTDGGGAARAAPHRRVGAKRWRVEVDVVEEGPETVAHAVLVSGPAPEGTPTALGAEGHAHRRPGDPDIPVIGDEVAVARALHRLADGLLGAASQDISAAEGHRVEIHA